jgi:myo-inositol catabolism protein IolC
MPEWIPRELKELKTMKDMKDKFNNDIEIWKKNQIEILEM